MMSEYLNLPDGDKFDSNEVAPAGSLFVCCACGKTSRTRYGIGNTNGWDESCMLNCQLFEESWLHYNEGGYTVREVRDPSKSPITGKDWIAQ